MTSVWSIQVVVILDNQVESESLVYWTKQDFQHVKHRVWQFVGEFDSNPASDTSGDERYPDALRLRGSWHARFLYVEVQRHGEMNQTFVRVDLLNETAARRHDPLRFIATASAQEKR